MTFTTPFDLAAGHYFFVPQVELNNGTFEWLSAPRPITSGTGPFVGDLQAWTRDAMLDPDWLRIGTDIVGGTTPPTFNMAFSITGVDAVPEPSTWAMMILGFDWHRLHGLSPEVKPTIDGRLIHDHRV